MPMAVPTRRPISAFRPETFVASQMSAVLVRNASKTADGAGRK